MPIEVFAPATFRSTLQCKGSVIPLIKINSVLMFPTEHPRIVFPSHSICPQSTSLLRSISLLTCQTITEHRLADADSSPGKWLSVDTRVT